ncbi:hypothetical protein VT84_13610 [Gemmata sp. SH-PL17]|uniref:hypothetical protein n=1 Tax=Gemmata sp. SH-PL17 TaxID=1630693 RepID=UPI00078D0C2F|nr:hypothetical protein [Gemmata sp. SH-PL17]AMV25433.1 hypothetical protein VT84_13610 [Gemmata sp. SH-PL17]
MALNLNDRIAVIRSTTMQTRCTGAVAKYALYLLGGSPTTPQLAWAREAIRDPATVGSAVSYHLLDDTNFLAGGSDITDAQLQGAVESAINNRFIQ